MSEFEKCEIERWWHKLPPGYEPVLVEKVIKETEKAIFAIYSFEGLGRRVLVKKPDWIPKSALRLRRARNICLS